MRTMAVVRNKPKSPARKRATQAKASSVRRAATRPAATKAAAAAADWRVATLERVRQLIREADPEIVEERKWKKATNPEGVPTWSHGGIVCTGETYKDVVKLTFARGAALDDPHGLFNASLDGNARRAIDLREGEQWNAKAFKALIKAAVAENLRSQAPHASAAKTTASKSLASRTALPKNAMKKSAPKKSAAAKSSSTRSAASKPSSMKTAVDRNGKKVTLLSGGNPQIAKADGDAPVQAYIDALQDWKHDVCKRIDELIVKAAPQVRKAVRWNSPFYGIEGQGWFASYHVFTRYVKLTFFRGASLKPVPPGAGKDADGRWIDIHEDDELDEAQLLSWIKQAAAIPGWNA